MKLGIYVRNLGPASNREDLIRAATIAEAARLHSIWVVDHVAIPPDQAFGSEGRYLEPLATLAFLAGCTERIMLGSAALVIPYRPALIMAKWIATIQELSANRLLLGAAVGWMEEEFAALGVDFARRGAITNRTLSLLTDWFAQDEAQANGVRFLFKPRPTRPPIFVGGWAPQALRRCVRFGEGWMPLGAKPDELAEHVASLREMAAYVGKPHPLVMPVTSLPMGDMEEALALAGRYREVGCGGMIHACRYSSVEEFEVEVGRLVELGRGLEKEGRGEG